MSSVEPVTFVDMAESGATRPVAIGTPSESKPPLGFPGRAVFVRDIADGTSGASVGGLKRWAAGVNGLEVTVMQSATLWGSDAFPAGTRMDQLAQTQAELREVARKVDALVEVVKDLGWLDLRSHAPGADRSPPTNEGIGSAIANDRVAELLDFIADEGVCPPVEAVELARNGLSSDDAELRAAASRVLSLAAPDDARSLLPAAIEAEGNAFTAAVMRGALRAIS